MIHFGEVFSELLENSNMTMDEVATRIGCKTSNLYKMRHKESIDTRLLDSVCRALGVSPLIFFEPDVLKNEIPIDRPIYKNNAVLGKATMNIGLMEEVRNLKEKIEEKEKLLAEKERFIQFLIKDKTDS